MRSSAITALSAVPFVLCSIFTACRSSYDNGDSGDDDFIEDGGSVEDDDDENGNEWDHDSVDDDEGDDAPENPLVLIGRDRYVRASWLQTSDGWRRITFPGPITPVGGARYAELGPSVCANGRDLYTSWNVFVDAVGFPTMIQATVGFEWLRFNIDQLWTNETDLSSTRAGHVLDELDASPDGDLWVASRYWSHISDPGFPLGERTFRWETLFRYDDFHPRAVREFGTANLEGLAIADNGKGWAFIDGEYDQFLSLDGVWSSSSPQTGYEDGEFRSFVTDDGVTGVGVFCEQDSTTCRLVGNDGSTWRDIDLPESCHGVYSFSPETLLGSMDHWVSFNGDQSLFLQSVHGAMECRNLKSYGTQVRVVRVIPLADRRAFAFAVDDANDKPFLVFIENGTIEEWDLPPDLAALTRINVVGPDAPRRQ